WLLDAPDHAGITRLVGDLNRLYRATPALWEHDHDPTGFAWIDANDSGNNVFSFLRFAADGPDGPDGSRTVIASVTNFANTVHEAYRIGVPLSGRWEEVLNTDSEVYTGSGVGNLGGVDATEEPWHGQVASLSLRLPPLATVWLRHVPE